VDSVILPRWARNNHHFVYMNYVALESNTARNELCHWIDLIFGSKQHSVKDYNLFRPLTYEVVCSLNW